MKVEISSGVEAQVKGWMRLLGFILLMILFFPVLVILRFSSKKYELLGPLIFYRLLMKMMGFTVCVQGKRTVRCPTLFVSNHSSYLDVVVLGSLIPGSFVAKSEVALWPVIGWLAQLQNTVFVERRAICAGTQSNELRKNLNQRKNLILFPEGTSSDGHHTLPFKSSLFSIAEKELDGGESVYVQPVSVVCTKIAGLPMGHLWRPYYAWYGDMTFARHLWDVFKIGAFTVDVVFHPVVTIKDFSSRKEMSQHCQNIIAVGVNGSVTGRPEKEVKA